jgi:hypothetical protein
MDTILQDIRQEILFQETEYKQTLSQHSFLLESKRISKELAKFLKVVPTSKMTRIEVYQKVYLYMFKNKMLFTDQTFSTEHTILFGKTKEKKLHLKMLPVVLDHHFSK